MIRCLWTLTEVFGCTKSLMCLITSPLPHPHPPAIAMPLENRFQRENNEFCLHCVKLLSIHMYSICIIITTIVLLHAKWTYNKMFICHVHCWKVYDTKFTEKIYTQNNTDRVSQVDHSYTQSTLRTATFEPLGVLVSHIKCQFVVDLNYNIMGKIKLQAHKRGWSTYQWWFVEMPSKHTPVSVVISPRDSFKPNLTLVPSYALKEQAERKRNETKNCVHRCIKYCQNPGKSQRLIWSHDPIVPCDLSSISVSPAEVPRDHVTNYVYNMTCHI